MSLSATCVALACPGAAVAARGGQPGPDAHSGKPVAPAAVAPAAVAPAASAKPVPPGHQPGHGGGKSHRNAAAVTLPPAPAQAPAPAPVPDVGGVVLGGSAAGTTATASSNRASNAGSARRRGTARTRANGRRAASPTVLAATAGVVASQRSGAVARPPKRATGLHRLRAALPIAERRPAASFAAENISAPVVRFVEHIPDWILIALGALAVIGLALAAALFVFARRLRRSSKHADHLAALADTDVLTGLLNRRGVEQRLHAEVSRATRHKRPLAVAFADLRGLKAVNDRYGHDTGDEVIRRVGHVLAAEARDGDICGRMGGDEYAVGLVEADEAGADAFRERVLGGIDAARRELGLDTEWDLTLGTALYPRDGDTAEELIAVADRRLYAERGIRLSR